MLLFRKIEQNENDSSGGWNLSLLEVVTEFLKVALQSKSSQGPYFSLVKIIVISVSVIRTLTIGWQYI